MPFVVAEASALAAAASTVLQHHASRVAPAGARRLFTHLLTSPLWMLGLLAGAAGLVLHVVALATGPLVVVQPLLVSGILFALPLSVALERRVPAVTDAWLALLLVAGLAVFLLTVHPSSAAAPASTGTLVGWCAATLAGTGLLTAVGLRLVRRGRRTSLGAVLQGAAGGIGFGLTAALLKQATALYAISPAELARSWVWVAVLAVGALSVVVTQLGFQAGPLAWSLPAHTVGDPIAAVGLGLLAFGERLRETTGMLVWGGIALLVMGMASAMLTRRQKDLV